LSPVAVTLKTAVPRQATTVWFVGWLVMTGGRCVETTTEPHFESPVA